jgi:hypothetical protein
VEADRKWVYENKNASTLTFSAKKIRKSSFEGKNPATFIGLNDEAQNEILAVCSS